jgi:hopanoid biosynthesis associated protein HpnK
VTGQHLPKLLIVNADDFGMSEAVNSAIERAHRFGTLTSTSLMMGEPACSHAVTTARCNPDLAVGLHVTVTADHAVLDRTENSSLVDSHRRLRGNALSAGLLYRFSSRVKDQLRSEMDAQFTAFKATGLTWSHADGHQHFHMHPVVWEHFLGLCEQHGVFRIRIPIEGFRSHLSSGGDRSVPLALAGLILRSMSRRNLARLTKRPDAGRWFVPDRSYGTFQSGNMHAIYVLKTMDRLEGVTNEVYLHPGTEYARQLDASNYKADLRDVELHALLQPALRDRITQSDIKLTTYSAAQAILADESWRSSATL